MTTTIFLFAAETAARAHGDRSRVLPKESPPARTQEVATSAGQGEPSRGFCPRYRTVPNCRAISTSIVPDCVLAIVPMLGSSDHDYVATLMLRRQSE